MESTISWKEDYRTRVNPELLTELLHEAVPISRYIKLQVVETAEGFAQTLLPLNFESTNQYETHQAALIAIAADYTGGIALATLLRGIPIIGFHSQTLDNGAALWLISINIRYLVPSADDLTVSAKISEESFERIRTRYYAGEKCIENVELTFESEGEKIATGTLTYFLKQSKCLKPQSAAAKINILFSHRVKASARLIAGLRASENTNPNPLYSDQYSAIAAKRHGKLLAERFTRILPQLRDMVAARTKDIDDLILQSIEKGIKQLVFVGVGFDFRIFRLLKSSKDIKVFEIDLPGMVLERDKILATIEGLPCIQRETIGINLELEDLNEVLRTRGFNSSESSLFIIEGLSVYLDEHTNKKILSGVNKLMQNKNSMLWIDIVAKKGIERKSGPEVQEFLNGMEKLGEPFIFGLDHPETFFDELEYDVYKKVASSFYQSNSTDLIFNLYNFYAVTSKNGNA